MSEGSLARPAPVGRKPLAVSRSGLMALEPRMLFDGAVGITADAALETQNGSSGTDRAIEIKTSAAPVNQAPVANADHRQAGSDSGPLIGNVITGAAPGDVADYDPDGDAFAVFGVIAGDQTEVPLGNVGTPVRGEHGTLLMYDDGSYRYTPDASVADLPPGEMVSDHFGYLICDDAGNISTTTLTVSFTSPDPAGPTPSPPPAPAPIEPPVDVAPPPPAPAPVEPPVDVAPPTPQPVLPVPEPPGGSTDPDTGTALPLPPTTGDPLLNTGDPFAGRDGDGLLSPAAAPFTLLSADSAQPATLSNGDAFSPFAPAAVLGMVETSPDRDARLAKAPLSSSDGSEQSDSEQSAAEPADKPQAVKRSAVLGDTPADKPVAGRFSDTIRDNARQVAPLQKATAQSARNR